MVEKCSRELERAHSLTEEGENLNSFMTCMENFQGLLGLQIKIPYA